MNETPAPAPTASPLAFSAASMYAFLAAISFLPDDHLLRHEPVMGIERENGEVVAIQFQGCSLVRVDKHWVQMDNGRPIAIYK